MGEKEALGSMPVTLPAIKVKKETILQLTDSKVGKTYKRNIKFFLGLNSKTPLYLQGTTEW